MNRYSCMPHPTLFDGGLAIEAVQPDQIEAIRQWRNAQMNVLRQTAIISPTQQQRYFETHIWPEMTQPQPRNILLSYRENQAHIGYGGLVHIAWEHRRAEVSFLLDPIFAAQVEPYARYFSEFLQLIKRLAFDDLGLGRLFTETYASRDHHMAVLESAGFRREGVLRQHVMAEGQPVDSIMHGCLESDGR